MFSRCSNCLWHRLHRGEVGAVGGASPGWLLRTGSCCIISHDFHWKHLGLLHHLHHLQVPVHAADNNSHVRLIILFKTILYCINLALVNRKMYSCKVSNCSRPVDGKVCSGVWGQQLWSSASADNHHFCCG